jgi:quinol monooxygenase YgiN
LVQPKGLRFIGSFVANADRVEDLRTLLRSLIDPSRKEQGCVSYEVLHNVSDPTDFAVVAGWANFSRLLHRLGAMNVWSRKRPAP